MKLPHFINLDGGERIAFQEWGSPAGRPVIHFHGTPGSRLERYPDDDLTSAMGIRFITFDRPGYGRSPPLTEWTLRRCAEVVGLLADHLRLREVRLHGFSAGGPYVLATAHELQGRVGAAAILAGLGPLDRLDALEGMSADNAEAFRVAREEPTRLPVVLSRSRSSPAMPVSEMEMLGTLPRILDMLLESHSEMTRQGIAGSLSDHLAFAHPWDFALNAIAVPVHLWHGDQDPLVPLHHSKAVASSVPGANLTICAGEGHFSMFQSQREILSLLCR